MQVVNRDELWCEETNTEKDAETDIIYYQEKGYQGGKYYKTFLWTDDGCFEGIGETLKLAVDSVKLWAGEL